MPPYSHISDRLKKRSNLIQETGCVVWTGSSDQCGYGKINGGIDMPGETLAHRAAYKTWVGPIPNGCEIDHRCNNRSCINPDHLSAVPHALNVSYADYKTGHRNAVKTRCKRGHEFTEENTIHEKTPHGSARKCRTCRADAQVRRRAVSRDERKQA